MRREIRLDSSSYTDEMEYSPCTSSTTHPRILRTSFVTDESDSTAIMSPQGSYKYFCTIPSESSLLMSCPQASKVFRIHFPSERTIRTGYPFTSRSYLITLPSKVSSIKAQPE